MNGIILYADDDVLNSNSSENKLFQIFNNSTDHSVLPITNLEDLQKTISSISTFRALLLDWTFKKPKVDEDMPEVNENSFDFLKTNKVYSLVYIYSRESLPPHIKEELIDIYGDGKIFFEQKSGDFDEKKEFEKICKGLSDFEKANKHMEIPFVWSQTINKTTQEIFRELEEADLNWIKEIMDTASADGAEPFSEVIRIFHIILNESLIQDDDLRKSLSDYRPNNETASEVNTAKLYRRLFYTKLNTSAPIMTGDIFKFDENEYGILITPECDINEQNKDSYEFLVIKKDLSGKFQEEKTRKNFNDAKKIFNNGVIKQHILASFPFNEDKFNTIALIEFSSAFKNKDKNEIIECRTLYKLNSPYIHQLRQRYVAFIGRYGVPALPDSLKKYHLT